MQALGADDPRQVGGYRLLRRLGAGGMGRVYLGRTAGGRTVAVKVVRGELAEDAEFRARFRQEVAAARRVGGTWTAPVLDADTEGEHPWVATGYVAGPALGNAVRDFGPLPEPAVRTLGVGLAEALGHVHGLGLVHRDVKPSNVLLTLDGPRLIDFGIARALDATSGLTQSGYVVGSPGFMSPEQASGLPAGPASDVFSLGAVLAFAATGVHPFGEGVSVAVLLYRVLHEEPDLSGLSGPLHPVVLACLAKDPAARPTPQQLRERLDADGAATLRLGRGGWLPPELAAAVGRSAVELLDLEGEQGTGLGEAGGAGAGGGGGGGAGFGPGPVPGSGSWPGAASGAGVASGSGAGSGAAGLSGSAGMSAPADGWAVRTPTFGDGVPVGNGGPGAGSAEGGPVPTPSQDRRSGRGTAAVAGAAAAVLFLGGGGYGLYQWLGKSDPASTKAATTASTSTSPAGTTEPPPSPRADVPTTTTPGATGGVATPATTTTTGGPSAVPAAFLGTWRGEMTTARGLPAGATTLTIVPAAIGQDAVTSRNEITGLISVSCDGTWRLDSVSPDKLVFTSRLVRSSFPGACSGGSSSETLTLQKDGTIRFTSVDPDAGNPSGTMRKVS
ncbi:serine/threonine-protein kinase [Kitasatospora sp. NPDC090091]|uniref:serine/threonine-protein kinase n=1 Tax=Kitasatospora sp. NPDC090091 TaxID=3364081 RepID=UPI003813E2F2